MGSFIKGRERRGEREKERRAASREEKEREKEQKEEEEEVGRVPPFKGVTHTLPGPQGVGPGVPWMLTITSCECLPTQNKYQKKLLKGLNVG